jgi:hypothetical protein
MAFIAISLAFPVFIWMRPHWQDMLRLETAAQRFGEGILPNAFISTVCPASNVWAWPLTRWPTISTR